MNKSEQSYLLIIMICFTSDRYLHTENQSVFTLGGIYVDPLNVLYFVRQVYSMYTMYFIHM